MRHGHSDPLHERGQHEEGPAQEERGGDVLVPPGIQGCSDPSRLSRGPHLNPIPTSTSTPIHFPWRPCLETPECESLWRHPDPTGDPGSGSLESLGLGFLICERGLLRPPKDAMLLCCDCCPSQRSCACGDESLRALAQGPEPKKANEHLALLQIPSSIRGIFSNSLPSPARLVTSFWTQLCTSIRLPQGTQHLPKKDGSQMQLTFTSKTAGAQNSQQG